MVRFYATADGSWGDAEDMVVFPINDWTHVDWTALDAAPASQKIDVVKEVSTRLGNEIIDFARVADIAAAVADLPEQNATSGRDFGRGYALAIKDVLDMLHTLSPDTETGEVR